MAFLFRIYVSVLYWDFAAPDWTVRGRMLPPPTMPTALRLVTFFWLVFVALLVVSYLRVVSTDPGVVTPELANEFSRMVSDRAVKATFPETGRGTKMLRCDFT